jgi:hypothetical protein
MYDWLSNNSVNVTIRNTGSVDATVESISITVNETPYDWYTDVDVGTGTTIGVGGTINLVCDNISPVLVIDGSYVLRVTATTGLYDEMVVSTPSEFPAV